MGPLVCHLFLSPCLLTKYPLKAGTYIPALICYLIATAVTKLSYNNPGLFTVIYILRAQIKRHNFIQLYNYVCCLGSVTLHLPWWSESLTVGRVSGLKTVKICMSSS